VRPRCRRVEGTKSVICPTCGGGAMGAGRQAGAGGAAPAGRRGPPPATERQVVRSYNWISAMKTRFVGHGSVRPGLPGVRRRRHRAAWGAKREVLGVGEARFAASGGSGGGAGRATGQDLSHKTRFRSKKREIPSQAAGAPEGGCESRVDLLRGGVAVADGGRRCVREGPGGATGPGGRSSATGPLPLLAWLAGHTFCLISRNCCRELSGSPPCRNRRVRTPTMRRFLGRWSRRAIYRALFPRRRIDRPTISGSERRKAHAANRSGPGRRPRGPRGPATGAHKAG